ncbi:MAG: DNA-3-methyladenine glycosylase I [Proteobacteria bacterium]|nr:DNA-3-methyladenine glycosylase I [Pseudomonadota bacterium]
MNRCHWCGTDPLYMAYHDTEWGVPVHDDRKHFEFLLLETFQAGLSWITILRKRENFRAAFADFDPVRVAAFTQQDVERLMSDAGIIRNRSKIEAAITNACSFLELQKQEGSFDAYIWRFVDGAPLQPKRQSMKDVPPVTQLAEKISKDLKKRGFKFVGPTVIYANMQAIGMVNDHIAGCFRHAELA